VSYSFSLIDERDLDYLTKGAHSVLRDGGNNLPGGKGKDIMAHQWHSGVLASSSWHGLEEIGVMASADDMIRHGERSNAWPVAIDYSDVVTTCGLAVDKRAVVATYESAARAAVGVCGGRYAATTPESWRALVQAAAEAGAKPTGCFAFAGGSRVLATFDVGGNGIRTHLVIADSFDGSLKLTVGTTSVQVVCANTLASSLRTDGEDMAMLRHTTGLESKIAGLKNAIKLAVKEGETVKAAFEKAATTKLVDGSFDRAFNLLFPEAPEGSSKVAVTRAENARRDALVAANMTINNYGGSANVGTLWSAATYLVDRNADGSNRWLRGEASALENMLFGTRADRIDEIQSLIEVVMNDGTYSKMTVNEAVEHGISAKAIAESFMAEMLGD
jgi:hypothetical protein